MDDRPFGMLQVGNVSTFMKAPKFDWRYLIVLGLSFPVLWPLVGPSYLSSHDGLHHLSRLVDLDWVIRGGVLSPRWLPNLGFGYGYPVLNYYAPLSYYLAELFHILGVGYIDGIKLAYALGFLGSGPAMYLFHKELVGRLPAAADFTTRESHSSCSTPKRSVKSLIRSRIRSVVQSICRLLLA